MQQRIQKIIAAAGIASRRKAEELIAAGRVKVNGRTARIGESADDGTDAITVDNEPLPKQKKRYILLYKPYGYTTTTSDPYERKLVTDLVDLPEELFPVGRLDKDTEGLLILTNDGGFANKVMHPRYEVEKTYFVELEDRIGSSELQQLQHGIMIEGRKVTVKVRKLSPDAVEVTLHEGRHKIVKRLFRKLGNYVKGLNRIRIGSVTGRGLKRGKWRELTESEIKSLQG